MTLSSALKRRWNFTKVFVSDATVVRKYLCCILETKHQYRRLTAKLTSRETKFDPNVYEPSTFIEGA